MIKKRVLKAKEEATKKINKADDEKLRDGLESNTQKRGIFVHLLLQKMFQFGFCNCKPCLHFTNHDKSVAQLREPKYTSSVPWLMSVLTTRFRHGKNDLTRLIPIFWGKSCVSSFTFLPFLICIRVRKHSACFLVTH